MATVRLQTPLDEALVRSLRIGDQVLLSGRIHTARDAAHKYLASEGTSPATLPAGLELQGGVLYHCGPVMAEAGA